MEHSCSTALRSTLVRSTTSRWSSRICAVSAASSIRCGRHARRAHEHARARTTLPSARTLTPLSRAVLQVVLLFTWLLKLKEYKEQLRCVKLVQKAFRRKGLLKKLLTDETAQVAHDSS